MGILYDTMKSLARSHDAEMLVGFQRYEDLLATILTPEQMETYAASATNGQDSYL